MIDSFEQWKNNQQDQMDKLSYEELVNSAGLKSFLSSPTWQSVETLSRDHNKVVHTYINTYNFARSIKLGDWKLSLQSKIQQAKMTGGIVGCNTSREL